MWRARPWSPHVTGGRLDDSWWRSAHSFSFSGNALLLSPASLCVCVCICRLDTFYYRLNICCSLQDGSCQRSRDRHFCLVYGMAGGLLILWLSQPSSPHKELENLTACCSNCKHKLKSEDAIKMWLMSLQGLCHAIWLTDKGYTGENAEEMKCEPIQGGLKVLCVLYCVLLFLIYI